MAVYKRNYKGYAGVLTPRWSRFLILTRYSYARLFQSRLMTIFLMVCFIPPLAFAAYLYLSHNTKFLALMRVQVDESQVIGGGFFFYHTFVQGFLATVLTALIGPNLISPDLVNGALPLYFCRPFSRLQYIAGKISVLLALLSLLTWVPGLILFLIQSSLAGSAWMFDNLWLAWGIFLGLFVWILFLSLLALAISAWVKWKIAAGALVLGIFFAGAGFGNAIDVVLRTHYGTLINLIGLARIIQTDLLGYDARYEIPASSAWFVLTIVGLFFLFVLTRRVRAFEVVK